MGSILAAGTAIAWAGSQGSVLAWGVPLFALCGALSFAVNWAAFVPAYVLQTEHYFDLMGSVTHCTLMLSGLALGGAADARSALLAALVVAWALRLGSFLFTRIRQDGSDGRFDAMKPHFPTFLMVWTLQGLWVFVTVSCALAAVTSARKAPLGWPALVGTALYTAGLAIEVTADRQKRAFRAAPANRGRFITSGLWSRSRHPNYFGEILLWCGIALVAAPALSGWQFVTLVSPVFVYFLLMRVSGVPLLEARAKRKWGEEPEYRAYKRQTPVLVPRLW